MPECIVCKANYTPDDPCPRCDSDNSAWDLWRQACPEEQGGGWSLLFFMEPYFYIPLVIAAASLFFGLLGAATMWKGIQSSICLLTMFGTPCICLVAIVEVYQNRHKLRYDDALSKVRQGLQNVRSPQVMMILVPGIMVVLIMLMTLGLAFSDLLWKLTEIFILVEPDLDESSVEQPPPEDTHMGILQRLKRAMPPTTLFAYVALATSITYASSMSLAFAYAKRLDAVVPPPIFLQDTLLARVVREEAELLLGRERPALTNETWARCEQEQELQQEVRYRLSPPAVSPSSKDLMVRQMHEYLTESANWTWEEMERTSNGGIRFKVIKYIIRRRFAPDGSKADIYAQVQYIVTAGPWGHVREIKSAGEAGDKARKK